MAKYTLLITRSIVSEKIDNLHNVPQDPQYIRVKYFSPEILENSFELL